MPASLTGGSCGEPASGLTALPDADDLKTSAAIEHEDCSAELITALMVGETATRGVASGAAP